MGTIMERAPTPAPVIRRPTAICCQLELEAIWITTPTMNMRDQKVMEYLRPMRSAMGAAARAPARVPIESFVVSVGEELVGRKLHVLPDQQ